MQNDLFILNPLSKNKKVGLGVAVSTSNSSTCPDSCALKGKQCYARFGPTNLHWMKLDEGKRGGNWEQFIQSVELLPTGWKFRHNEAGDLPGTNMEIDSIRLSGLSKVVKSRKLRAWTYTHKPLTESNTQAIRDAIADGFVINISADTPAQADHARKLGLPTVMVVPQNTPNGATTPEGNKIIICPNQTKGLTCAQCMLCHKAQRSVVVGFRAHGTAAKSLDKKLSEII